MAAETAWSAGLTERALGLLDAHARTDPPDAARVRELALRGGIAARTGRLRDAREMLVAAADLSTDPAEECTYLSDAVHASFYLAGVPAALQIARTAGDARPARHRPQGPGAGADRDRDDPRRRRARPAAPRTCAPPCRSSGPPPALHQDPHRLSCVMLVPLFLRDADQAATLLEYVDQVRSVAGVGALPAVLFHVARDQATTSSWAEAEANYCEAVRLAEETGQVTERVMSLAGLCWLEARQGREDACRVLRRGRARRSWRPRTCTWPRPGPASRSATSSCRSASRPAPSSSSARSRT